ncbi:MAG: hypothetical protein JXR76_28710 [Deltaproteobacteria bacterium]|nr:hypothetical protein [Deltaproteobacteria bacterium]
MCKYLIIFILGWCTLACGATASRGETGAIPDAVNSENASDGEPSVRDLSMAPLAFGWTAPSRAIVRDTTKKKGKRAKIEYVIDFRHGDSSGGYILQISDFRFLEYEGQKVEGALAEQLKSVTAMSGIIPPLQISPQGAYDGLPDGFSMNQILTKMREGALKDVPQEVWQSMETLMSDPGFEATAVAAAGDFWRIWVESWVGFDGRKGEDVTRTSEVQLGKDLVSPVNIHMRNEGTDNQAKGLIRLTMRAVQDNPALVEFTVAALKAFATGNPESESATNAFVASIEKVRKTVEVTAVLHAADLRPVDVKSKEINSVTTKDGRTQDRIDTHHYTFEWQ